MIKYFCDICQKEMKQSNDHFAYILPYFVKYQTVTIYGEPILTYEKLEDKELHICPYCRSKVANFLKEQRNEKS